MSGIEIGGGHVPAPGFYNLDPVHGEGEWRRCAQDTPWPTRDGSVTRIKASHVLEHIPAGDARINVFNEAHRVLARDGVFEVIVPLMVGTWHAIADPTHISFWVPESFHYFTHQIEPQASYGIKKWRTTWWEVVDGWEGRWIGSPA